MLYRGKLTAISINSWVLGTANQAMLAKTADRAEIHTSVWMDANPKIALVDVDRDSQPTSEFGGLIGLLRLFDQNTQIDIKGVFGKRSANCFITLHWLN